MALYAGRRVLQALIAIVGILTLLFALLHASSNPALVLAGPQSSEAVVNALNHRLGLDRPLGVQYLDFLKGALHLDFGTSYFFNKPALGVVLGALPASLVLVTVAEVISASLAFVIGTRAAVRGTATSRGVMVAAFFGQAVPFFWLALILVLIFALKLHVLPATGSLQSVGWTALILPVVALVVPNVATLSRLVRGQVVDVLAQPFVVTATSKGLPFRKVMRRHVLPNAVPPIISWIAIQFSFLLGATIIIEPIFNYQGIGTLMIQAVTNGDYSVVEAGVFFFALFVIGANLAADMLNHSLDPRLRVATH